MKSLAKAVMGKLVAEYRINWIYAADRPDAAPDPAFAIGPENSLHRAALHASPTGKMRNSQSFARAGLAGVVLAQAGHPLCVAHFAEPGQYDRCSTWPLRNGEVALMDIATEERARGQGLAVHLIRGATRHYLSLGHTRLIAFIWWSNAPSIRAFTKAGWRRIGLSIDVRGGRRWRSLRIALPPRL